MKILIIIFSIFCYCSGLIYGQSNNSILLEYPEINLSQAISLKINELSNLGEIFNYHNQIKNGNYIISFNDRKVYLKILNKIWKAV